MDQIVEPLSQIDRQNLERARDWLKGFFSTGAEEKYATIDDKLRLLDTILREKWIDSRETNKLQSLGVAFGDALTQKLGMEWVMVEDEYGRTPSICFAGTKLMAHPLTTISKRVEDGENVDVYDLFEGFCEKLTKLKADGWK
ncbi:MAG: DUF3806 domain-containing protein [Rhizomicrobium sp.]